MNTENHISEPNDSVQNQLDELFTDPKVGKHLTFFRQNSIITRSKIIWDLLNLLKTSNENNKALMLEYIQGCLAKFPLNSLSLANLPRQKVEGNEVQSVIEVFIENAMRAFQDDSDRIIQNYLVIIPTLYRFTKLEKSHLTKIYSILSEKYYDEKLTNAFLFYTFRLLRNILTLQISKLEGSTSFFYFTGLHSKISVPNLYLSPWPFTSGFALSIWFYLEDANKLVSSQTLATETHGKTYVRLFTVYCQGGGGVELYFKGETLYYRLIGLNYDDEPNEHQRLVIGEFHPNNWYYLGIEHETQRMILKPHVNIVVNNDYKRSVNFEYPRINPASQITKFNFGENMVGRISSVILFKSCIGQSKLSDIFSLFKHGVQDNSSIRNLSLSIQKVLDKAMLMYAPIRSSHDKCYDTFNSLHGKLDINSGFTLNDFAKFKFKSLGGLTSILPLFYLLSNSHLVLNMISKGFVTDYSQEGLLNELWKLLIVILKGQPENQVEAGKIGLFKIIGQLLSETSNNFFNFESIELLAELRNCLARPQLDAEMFVNLLWRAEIYTNTDLEVRNQIWGYIRTIYLQNPAHYFSLFKIKDILDLAIDQYDAPLKKKAFENCNKEWNSTKTPEFKQAEMILGSIFSTELSILFLRVQDIVEAILFSGGHSVAEGVLSVVRVLTFKCSPYFHLLILKMLKNLVINKRDHKTTMSISYTKLLLENNIIHILLYLMTNTNCLDLKATCIKFLNKFIHHHSNTIPELDVTTYISETIWSPLSGPKDNEYDSDLSSSSYGSHNKGLSDHLDRVRKSHGHGQSVFSPLKGHNLNLESHIINIKRKSSIQSDPGAVQFDDRASPIIERSSALSSSNKLINQSPKFSFKNTTPSRVNKVNEHGSRSHSNQHALVESVDEILTRQKSKDDMAVNLSGTTEKSESNSPKQNKDGNNTMPEIALYPKQSVSPALNRKSHSKLNQSNSIDMNDSEYNYEPLYVSLLEWLLNKNPSSLEATVMIDDSDRIKSTNIVFVLMKVFKHVPEYVKQKIIQDIYMLIKWSPKNCQSILEIPEFQYFLLDTLYKYQLAFYDVELKGVSMAVWELGIKTYLLLMRYVLLNNPQGWKYLQNLFIWIENKRVLMANRPNSTKNEKAVCYLVQYIWLNMLESLLSDASTSSLSRDLVLWTNLVQITYFTKYIVTSAFNPSILSAVNAELEEKNLSPISNFITKLPPGEAYPLKNLDFKSIFSKSSWTDWKICETLFKILEHLWVESVFSQAGIVGNTSETQKLEKRIHNLMDPSQTEEQTQILMIFFLESLEDKVSGCFLKVLLQLLTCYLEDAAKNGIVDSTSFACKEIENLSKFLLIACENVREKRLTPSQQTFLVSTILCFLKFLYDLHSIVKDEGIKKLLITCLRRILMHLMCQIDYINKKTGDFTNLSDVRDLLQSSPQKENIKGGFSFLTFDMILNYITVRNEPIITIQSLKTLKLQDFSSLEEILVTNEWKAAFTNSEKMNKVINDFYGGSLYSVNTEISKKIQDYAYNQTSVIINQEKAREDVCKKLELDILEIAIDISEQESQRRQASLAKEEEIIRMAKNSWRQLWKKLRIYVGQWAHPRFYDQEDFKFSFEQENYDNMQKNVLFSHKIAKYETKSRARPFLKVKLFEPGYVEEYNKILKENRADIHDIINSLDSHLFLNRNLTITEFEMQRKKSIQKPTTNSKRNSIASNNVSSSTQETTKNESFVSKLSNFSMTPEIKVSTELNSKDEVLLVLKCQWIKTLTIRNGHIQITSHQINLINQRFILEGLDQQENHISFMKHSLPVDRKISKEWPIAWIREIQRRRYIFRKTAIEIFLIDGSSLFFNFPEGGIDDITQLFSKMKKLETYSFIYYGSYDAKKILEKSGLTKKWMNHEISNFEYLIHLNALAGRSYKDMTQYPVFPWVLNNFSLPAINLKESQFYRDMTKSMGAMGSRERIQTFLERYENFDPFNPVPKFHFGSHYSSPAIILQYLVRLAPYTQGAIQLQGGKFDLADRLFHSMEESFKGATEEISDVRELIPEFFCLPDFFINKEKLDFSKTQSGVRVHHVNTPKWCGNNPYRFVAMMRAALESDIVSKSINNWIDLVFGYKQVGKEAEKSLNVFYYMTYEDNVDLDKLTDQVTKMSYEAQIVHFGQTPLQLFSKPHPQRNFLLPPRFLTDSILALKVYRSQSKKSDKDSDSQHPSMANGDGLVKFKILSEARIVGLRKNGKISYFKCWTSFSNADISNGTAFKFGVEKEKAVKLNRRKADFFDYADSSVAYSPYPYAFLESGKVIVAGGYWDGRLNMYSIEKDILFDSYYAHSDTITSLVVDSEESMLITGSKSGECIIWNISAELTKLSVKFQFYDHKDKINYIHISEELRLFATASDDGRINIYHYLLGRIFRTIYHPLNLRIQTATLSSSPVACVVFFSPENRTLYSYSINGRLLESIVDGSEVAIAPMILKDSNYLEILIYGNDKGDVYFRDLPFLTLRKKFEVTQNIPILTVFASNDKKYLFCGSDDGELSFITDPCFILQNPLKSSEET